MLSFKSFLYVKVHKKTGLKYFGVTTQDPFKYRGSGKYWARHLDKHGGGKKNVDTIWAMEFTNRDELHEFATWFSEHYKIVESREWANMIPEDGVQAGVAHTNETREKIRQWNIGRKMSPEAIEKNRLARIGGKRSEETRQKMREARQRYLSTHVKF
jgi:hypothetical protein